jgi:hypothetical protein
MGSSDTIRAPDPRCCVHPAALLLVLAAIGARAEYHRYVVVGAGPGGLQLAHYLESAGRDYLVLDKACYGRSSPRQCREYIVYCKGQAGDRARGLGRCFFPCFLLRAHAITLPFRLSILHCRHLSLAASSGVIRASGS